MASSSVLPKRIIKVRAVPGRNPPAPRTGARARRTTAGRGGEDLPASARQRGGRGAGSRRSVGRAASSCSGARGLRRGEAHAHASVDRWCARAPSRSPGTQETQRLLADPAPGISASPDENNQRHFHVVIFGPKDTPFDGGLFKLELFLPEDYPMAAPKVRFLTKIYHPNIDKVRRSPRGAADFARTQRSPRGAAARRAATASLTLVSVDDGSPRARATQLGRICLDILKDKWSPALQIRTVLLRCGSPHRRRAEGVAGQRRGGARAHSPARGPAGCGRGSSDALPCARGPMRRRNSIQGLLSTPNVEDPLLEDVAKVWQENPDEAHKTAKDWTRMYASE